MLLNLLFGEGNAPLAYCLIVFAILGSIVLHELGHALAATWEGDPTPKIRGHLTWNPVVHMGWLSILAVCVLGIGWGATPVTPSRFRHRRWGSVIVSFSGPAVHILLAIVGAVMSSVTQTSLAGGGPGAATMVLFWQLVTQFNALLLVFNMIPIPPFDGFTVAEGIFDLGELGDTLRRAHPIPFIAAWILVSRGIVPIHAWADAAGRSLIEAFGGRALF